MSNLGLGVMINMLGGNEKSVEAFKSCLGKTIKELSVVEDTGLHFAFEDGSKMRLFDDGQSCCERRYMRTDDKLSDFIGSKLLSAATKPAPGIETGRGDHEIEFLDVTTDRGVFQMVSHNEHNGYYGGFCVRCEME